MSKRDIEKLMEVYVCNPNVYEYAYSNCQEYKTFIDNLSEDALSKIKRAHAAWKISNGTDKFREGLFHTATFGLSFGAKKLLNRNKKSMHISDTYGHCFRKHPDSDFGIIRTVISAHPDTLSKD